MDVQKRLFINLKINTPGDGSPAHKKINSIHNKGAIPEFFRFLTFQAA